MMRGHKSLLLRHLFSTTKKKHKKNSICPINVVNPNKISPVKCYATEKDKTNCACKRRRKDIDKRKVLDSSSSGSMFS
jgi:hypothetical protein